MDLTVNDADRITMSHLKITSVSHVIVIPLVSKSQGHSSPLAEIEDANEKLLQHHSSLSMCVTLVTEFQ